MSILWGKDKQLDYWAALEADQVPAAERRAMGLLASISDEKRFSFYCLSGMFPAMGDVTKRIYLVRRWTTVLELEDGQPKASWCILAQDRMIAPETDHVVAMKNILEGSEMHFRQIGNAFHHDHDPFRGSVAPKTSFPNPYYNQIGPGPHPETTDDYELVDTPTGRMLPPRIALSRPRNQQRQAVESSWNEDSALQFRELEGWMKALRVKAEVNAEARIAEGRRQATHDAAVFRPRLLRDALIERAKDWVRIPPKERYKLPLTNFEEMADRAQRAMNNIGAMYGLGQSGGNGVFGASTATGITINGNMANNAHFYVNNAGTVGPVNHQFIGFQ